MNISIVEGLTEKPVSDVSYKLNVSSDDNSVIDQEIIHVGTDKLDISLDDSNLIEIVLSDMGQLDETLNFKFRIDP